MPNLGGAGPLSLVVRRLGSDRMEVVDIPADLAAFLDAGHQFDYEPSACEAGLVTLTPRIGLRLRTFGAQCCGTPHEEADPHAGDSGTYRVPGVDLIAS